MKHTFVIDRHRHKDMHLLVRVLRIRVYTGACTHDIHKRMHLRFECGERERERERGGSEGCEVQESLRARAAFRWSTMSQRLEICHQS